LLGFPCLLNLSQAASSASGDFMSLQWDFARLCIPWIIEDDFQQSGEYMTATGSQRRNSPMD
jgi:hypothetical protein